jgi:hypothetical protein
MAEVEVEVVVRMAHPAVAVAVLGRGVPLVEEPVVRVVMEETLPITFLVIIQLLVVAVLLKMVKLLELLVLVGMAEMAKIGVIHLVQHTEKVGYLLVVVAEETALLLLMVVLVELVVVEASVIAARWMDKRILVVAVLVNPQISVKHRAQAGPVSSLSNIKTLCLLLHHLAFPETLPAM